jgi:hypothetical protein
MNVGTHLDLIERELLRALEDIKNMRANEYDKKKVMNRSILLKVVLSNARHYIRALDKSLSDR